jgi:methionyl aminopeptidase
MTVRGQKDIDGLKKAGFAVADTLEAMKSALADGITTRELDRIGAERLKRHGAVSAPSKLYRFPGSTCISVNHEVAHGIPGDRVLRKGDLVNIDVSAELDGYYADTGFTVPFGVDDPLLLELCACSRRALKRALSVARAGEKLNRIGQVVEREAHAAGFETIRNLTGHGIGHKLHEDPSIFSYYEPRQRGALAKGQVVAIETFVSTGARWAEELEDGWTLVADDGGYVAQYEHTVIVTERDPIVVTRL